MDQNNYEKKSYGIAVISLVITLIIGIIGITGYTLKDFINKSTNSNTQQSSISSSLHNEESDPNTLNSQGKPQSEVPEKGAQSENLIEVSPNPSSDNSEPNNEPTDSSVSNNDGSNTAEDLYENFQIDNNILIKYTGTDISVVEVPDTITVIGKEAFSSNTSFYKIILPEGITEIGNKAFSYCSNLEEIKLPETLIDIGEDAFSFCSNLKKIVIPYQVTSIKSGTFFYNEMLNEVSLHNKIDSIGDAAFMSCTSLKNIYIPDSVKIIGQNVFYLAGGLISQDEAYQRGSMSIYNPQTYALDDITLHCSKDSYAYNYAVNNYLKVVTE